MNKFDEFRTRFINDESDSHIIMITERYLVGFSTTCWKKQSLIHSKKFKRVNSLLLSMSSSLYLVNYNHLLTEYGYKSLQVYEFNLDGYDLFPEKFPIQDTRDILVYIKQDLKAVEVNIDQDFKERLNSALDVLYLLFFGNASVIMIICGSDSSLMKRVLNSSNRHTVKLLQMSRCSLPLTLRHRLFLSLIVLVNKRAD
jgi:hypothetical protein